MRHKKVIQYQFAKKARAVSISISELDEDEEYLSRFSMEGLLDNQILLLYEKHELNSRWDEPSASHLWNYNLHYLEFLIPLAVKYRQTGEEKYKNRWSEILISWLESGQKSRDAWEPYTISLRIPNLLICLELMGAGAEEGLKKRIYESIYNQYRFLQKNLETALLANHYFENLKAVVMASIVFGERNVYHKYLDDFLKEIQEQILPDGVHYERSLMYHKIILEDILRLYMVLHSANHVFDGEKLVPVIKNMAEAMMGVETGFDRTPLFNDAGNNVSKPEKALLKVSRRIVGNLETRMAFPDSGYYRFDNGNCAVLFDCGDPGPKYMAGHAHNDCLSFELATNGRTIFTNSGTGQYQGELRQFFRSSYAHNTIVIDDGEQSELWGNHRAGRRIRQVRGRICGGRFEGRFYSYKGERYQRILCWKGDTLVIQDKVACRDEDLHIARQFFHLVPGFQYKRGQDGIQVMNGSLVMAVIHSKGDALIHREGRMTNYAPDFGRYGHKEVLEIRTPFHGSAELYVEIEIGNV